MTQQAYEILGEDRSGPWLVTCDHASNHVPEAVNGGTLGLPEADMARHIAWDPGAAGVTRALAEALDAPAILSRFSRLVIDPNRGADDPTLLMKLYDGTIIPGNRHAGEEERERRLDLYWRPYHRAIAATLDAAPRAYVSVHSFTPQLKGRPPRPWHVGLLHAGDRRLTDPLHAGLSDAGHVVGINEPYTGYLPGDAIDQHATARALPNVLIELRNDLIATAGQQRAWGIALAALLLAGGPMI